MKIIILIFFIAVQITAKTVTCVFSETMDTEIQKLFSSPIIYSHLQIQIQKSKQIFKALQDNNKVKFAIVRRDILWQLQTTHSIFKNSYITISELPFKQQLFLIQNEGSLDIDIDFLKAKNVSVGSLQEYNNYYLKALLKHYRMAHQVGYKSYTHQASLQQLMLGKIDAYFAFLSPSMMSHTLHTQTLFSNDTLAYFETIGIFDIRYDGIFSPYVLIASKDVTDEEIENSIYRLLEKNFFSPETDERFGPSNRFVKNHLAEVKWALDKRYTQNSTSQTPYQIPKACHQYHYGFLALLRQKPKLKNRLKHLYDREQRKQLLEKIETLLITIDENKVSCNVHFLNMQQKKFNRLKKQIYKATKHSF